ncbi:MAG: VacJ family lipoprotein [Acidiferrobacterales bacterium]
MVSVFLKGTQLPGKSRKFATILACLLLAGCATVEEADLTNTPDPETVGTELSEVLITDQAQSPEPLTEPDPDTEPGPDADINNDPWEGFNRAMYSFNDGLDEFVLKPTAKGYEYIMPHYISTGVTNFFSNLNEITVLVNNFLQGKIINGASDTARLLINSTLGLLGIIDVASYMHLEKHDEDFGQTLAVWGIGDGPFVVWPIIGARNMRDTVGWTGDWVTNPYTYVQPISINWSLAIADIIDDRALLLGAKDILTEASSGDPYIFMREAYKQQRLFKIYDGNPPVVEDAEFDALLFGDDDVKK